MGEQGAAIADYTEAIRLAPDFAQAYFNRGRAYEQAGDHAKAQADFAKAEKLGPKTERKSASPT